MHMQRILHQKDSEIVSLKVERDRKATECQGLQDVIHDMNIQNTELTQSIDCLQRKLRTTQSHTHLCKERGKRRAGACKSTTHRNPR